MNHEPTAVAAPFVKATTALTSGVGALGLEKSSVLDPGSIPLMARGFFHYLGITSWGEAAAAAAFVYSASLILEWWWKKFWRPLFERVGWLKPRKHRRVLVDTGFDQIP